MPSLSDKLKSLGVTLGTPKSNLPRVEKSAEQDLDRLLGGHPSHTPLGETYVIDSDYPLTLPHGFEPVSPIAALRWISLWCGDGRLNRMSASDFAFLDTETTGLAGGTGTLAFLVGIGRFEADHFHLTQFFLRDPGEEQALLVALESYLSRCAALVTFNGKAFDAPLLTTRYLLHGWQNPLAGLAHIDLLPLARRLWRDRLPSRTLGNLEYHILGISRTGEDIPGWMIPEIYFQYLRHGETAQLRNVLYHNAMDVVSLAALFNHSVSLLANPPLDSAQNGSDLLALARFFDSLGDIEMAIDLYAHGIGDETPVDLRLQAISRLAMIYKRQGDFASACSLWEKAAQHEHIEAFIELAKYHEHRQKNPQQALFWTESAIQVLRSPRFSSFERKMWLHDLQHRLERLQNKIARTRM